MTYEEWNKRASEICRRDGYANRENLAVLGPVPTIDSQNTQTGAQPVAPQTATAASVILAYNQAVASAKNRNPHWSSMQAGNYVKRTQPELFQQYLQATNPNFAWPR